MGDESLHGPGPGGFPEQGGLTDHRKVSVISSVCKLGVTSLGGGDAGGGCRGGGGIRTEEEE